MIRSWLNTAEIHSTKKTSDDDGVIKIKEEQIYIWVSPRALLNLAVNV